MLVPGQTSGSQNPHLVAPPARREDHSAPSTSCCPRHARPALAQGTVKGHARLTVPAAPKLPGTKKGRSVLWSWPLLCAWCWGVRPSWRLSHPTLVTTWPGGCYCSISQMKWLGSADNHLPRGTGLGKVVPPLATEFFIHDPMIWKSSPFQPTGPKT